MRVLQILLVQAALHPLSRQDIASATKLLYGQDTAVVRRLNLENLDKLLTGIQQGT